jgi:hypothetical protein
MSKTTKIVVKNTFSEIKTLFLEPWGEDYWMNSNDEFEIVSTTSDEGFYFQIDFGKDIIVYAEGQIIEIGVYQDKVLLICGHNRT